jgi:hypothetical protein
MIWILRKLLLPAIALGAGFWLHADLSADACLAAQGVQRGLICHGVAR